MNLATPLINLAGTAMSGVFSAMAQKKQNEATAKANKEREDFAVKQRNWEANYNSASMQRLRNLEAGFAPNFDIQSNPVGGASAPDIQSEDYGILQNAASDFGKNVSSIGNAMTNEENVEIMRSKAETEFKLALHQMWLGSETYKDKHEEHLQTMNLLKNQIASVEADTNLKGAEKEATLFDLEIRRKFGEALGDWQLKCAEKEFEIKTESLNTQKAQTKAYNASASQSYATANKLKAETDKAIFELEHGKHIAKTDAQNMLLQLANSGMPIDVAINDFQLRYGGQLSESDIRELKHIADVAIRNKDAQASHAESAAEIAKFQNEHKWTMLILGALKDFAGLGINAAAVGK